MLEARGSDRLPGSGSNREAFPAGYPGELIPTNGVELHVMQAGPEHGTPLVLLHGFPEFWWGWRRQIGFFAELGYRVIVPDQRGYHLSSRPARAAAYNLDLLAADIVGLLDGLGHANACVAGHDWGGIVAWWMAMKQPERVRRLAVLNAPHPKVFLRQVRQNPQQRRRSWYVYFFQLPVLPEIRMRANAWDIGRRALQRTSRPGTFPDDVVAAYIHAWKQPGALRGMINWYRAAWRARPVWPSSVFIEVPALIIWGRRDRFLLENLAGASLELCRQGSLAFIDTASHWVQHEEPEQVNRLLHTFFSAQGESGDA